MKFKNQLAFYIVFILLYPFIVVIELYFKPDASLIDSLVSMKEDLSSQEENLRRRLDGRGSKRSGTRVKAELAEAEVYSCHF